MGSLAVFIAVSLLAFTAEAQLRDRATLVHEVYGKKANVAAQQSEINLSHRTQFDEDGAQLLTTTLIYRSTALDFAPQSGGNNGTAISGQSVQLIVPQFTYLHVINDEYSLVTQLRTGFFGDWNGDFGQSFRVEGTVFVSKPWNENLTLGLGVGNGSNFGRVITVPVLQVLYFPSPKWMIDALLPVRADFIYLHSKDWEYGATFNIVGSQYRVDPRNFYGADTLQFANITVGGIVRRQTASNLYAFAELGSTVSRRFELKLGDQLVEDIKPENMIYGRLGLQYRF